MSFVSAGSLPAASIHAILKCGCLLQSPGTPEETRVGRSLGGDVIGLGCGWSAVGFQSSPGDSSVPPQPRKICFKNVLTVIPES